MKKSCAIPRTRRGRDCTAQRPKSRDCGTSADQSEHVNDAPEGVTRPVWGSTRFSGASLLLFLCILTACEREAEDIDLINGPSEPGFAISDESTFFGTVFIEEAAAFDAPSDGDLWPSAWSDDVFLYAVNGDGKGFGLDSAFSDIVSNRMSGHPRDRSLNGERLASGDRVGTIWSDSSMYNRKPTGMVSIGGVLYLAVQDLNKRGPHIFSEAPAATILRSDDKGRTWHWEEAAPMFKDYVFTTVMFLDYGKDGSDNIFDEYVYAYGLDHNWRDSFSDVVPDPDKLYLARMTHGAIQDVSKWEFYMGDLDGNPSWSEPGHIHRRRPVLQDDRRRYQETISASQPDSLSVISQGSIVYNRPLNRYIYTSWTEFTFEFYESPSPWGPWKLFLSKDFGAYPWTELSYGGYATTVPSKFISDDGTEMWVSSSTFVGGIEHYNFSLRRLWVTPYRKTAPSNQKSNVNLAASADLLNVSPISAAAVRFGRLTAINDGKKHVDNAVDSYSIEKKGEDYWGYIWPKAYNMNKMIYTTGEINNEAGGWLDDLRVQVRQEFQWIDVDNVIVTPAYPYNENVKISTSYSLSFDTSWGDGVRVIGRPGGSAEYTSIGELEVYYE